MSCLVVGGCSCNTVILVDVEVVLRIVFGFVTVYFILDVAVVLRILAVVVCLFVCRCRISVWTWTYAASVWLICLQR